MIVCRAPFACLALLILVIIQVHASPIYPTRVWVEQEGFVIIEAESVDLTLNREKWEMAIDPAGFTGTGYLKFLQTGNTYKDPLVYDAMLDPEITLIYKVLIKNPGEYAIHLRNYHLLPDGDNDVWVSINRSMAEKVWDHDAEEFTWSEFEKRHWQLTPGLNEIALTGRSKGFGVDRIVLRRTDVTKEIWGDSKRPESPLLVPALGNAGKPPPAPRNIRALERNESAILLEWDGSREEQTVLEYDVYVGNKKVGTSFSSRFLVSGLAEDTEYAASVRARNISGSVSASTAPIRVSTTSFDTARGAIFKYVREAPVIDGVVEEVWKRQIPYSINNLVEGASGPQLDHQASFRGCWDDQNLYLLVEVIDEVSFPAMAEGTSVWQADGLRLYLDPRNRKGEHFGIADRLYRVLGNQEPIRETISRDDFVKGVQAVTGGPPPPKRSWLPTPKGWLVEMAFSWETLGVEPEDRTVVGLDVVVQDNDDGQRLKSRVAWHGEGPDAGASPFLLGSARLVREIVSGSKEAYLPPQIWVEEQGVVVIEAEDIDHHPHWELRSQPSGYTGRGYLSWQGPERSSTVDGRGGNDDYTGERQGPQEEWLILAVLVSRPGVYRVNVRNFHLEKDGDNDAWVSQLGAAITDWNPVRRMGDSLADGPGFSWLDWGVRSFYLKRGLNHLYIGGRSRGFGLDRIVLSHTALDQGSALDPRRSVSRLAAGPPPTPPRTGSGIKVPVVADPVLTVDFGQKLHEWEGFGVNYVETAQTRDYQSWPQEYGSFSLLDETDRNRILDLIFGETGLKPSITKIFLDVFQAGLTKPTALPSEPGRIAFSLYDHQSTTRWLRYFNREGLRRTRSWGGDLTMLTTLYGPAPWMTRQKFILGRDLDPQERNEVAKYMTAWVKYLRDAEKLPVKYLSFHNEGDAYYRWPRDGSNPGEDHRDYNLYWPPAQVVDFLKLTRGVLDAHGLQDVGLTPGETQTWYRFDEWGYARAIFEDREALENLALITGHSFAQMQNLNSIYYGDYRSTGTDLLRSKKPGLRAWTTSLSWGKMDAAFVDSIRRNIYLAKCNAIIPWALIQRSSQWVGGDPNPGAAFRIFDEGTFEVLPGYYYYKQVTRAGQPGMAVAAVTSLDPSVVAIGFAANGTGHPDAFVLINLASGEKQVEVTVRGAAYASFSAWRTSEGGERYHRISDMELVNGHSLYKAPAGSVTTFFANGN